MQVTRAVSALALAAGLGLAAAPAGTAAEAAGRLAAAEGTDCATIDENTEVENLTGGNVPYEVLRIEEAHAQLARLGREPGEGVTVVLVDAGTRALTENQQAAPPLGGLTLESPHGSVAAGLLVGPPASDPTVPVGMAPAVRLVDAPFYEAPRGEAAEDDQAPTTEALAARLHWVAGSLRGLGDRVVVLVPTVVAHDKGLERALDALRDRALVVAPAGDRPADEADPVLGDFVYGEDDARRPDEDAARAAWPAGHDDVLAVGVEAPLDPDLLDEVVPNSQTDISAPTAGGASYGLVGGACALPDHSTEWAAAMVAAAAALVWTAHPGDTPLELRSRLLHTAAGSAGTTSPLAGHGMVQPVEAVERRFDPDPRGRADRPRRDAEAGERAPAPRDPEDVLAGTRRDAVWWGLLGGGALVVSMVLRPLLARRRG